VTGGYPVDVATTRRTTDLQRLRALEQRNPDGFKILETTGSPPNRYLVRLTCRSIESVSRNTPRYRTAHDLEITLPAGYPLAWPSVQVTTPIWNPHIFAGGQICLGGHAWNPTEFLDVFMLRLFSILTWDPLIINERSPANSIAMNWYCAHRGDFPLDRTSLRTGEVPKPRISWKTA
jgi:ubiquitin-protein ligase